MADVIQAATGLLAEVEKMVGYYADHEPERLKRRGLQNVVTAALDLEEALEGYELSDPSEDTPGLVGRSHPDTSREASLAVMPRTGTQRMDVLEFIVAAGDEGAIDEEIRNGIGIRYSSGCARRKELELGGWICDSGRTRPTETGNDSIVWVLTSKAREELG